MRRGKHTKVFHYFKRRRWEYLVIVFLCAVAYFGYLQILFDEGCFKAQSNRLRDYKHYEVDEQQVDLIYQSLLTVYPYLKPWKLSLRYWSYIIFDQARQNNLDWSLIAATVHIESDFNPTLKSPCNARGICQLLEGTCLAQCKKLGIPYEPGVTVWRDIDNLLLGVSYLKEAAKMTEDTKQIASHYCGGPAWQKSSNQEYILEYGLAVVEEQAKLKLIYKGHQKK